jgi:hypothetical protein
MESKCVVCHDKAAKFRCIQCHKPVCDDCAFKTEHGVFCGRECNASYREFKQAQGKTAGKRGLKGKLITIIVIAALAYALYWAYKNGMIPGVGGG